MQQLQKASNKVSVLSILMGNCISDMIAHKDDLSYRLSVIPNFTALLTEFGSALDELLDSSNDLIEGLKNEITDISRFYS